MREEHACAMVVDGAYWSKHEKQHDLEIANTLQYIQQELGAEIQKRFWFGSPLTESRRNYLRSATGPRFVVKEYPAKTWECPVCHCQSTVQTGRDIGIALRIFRLTREYRRIVVLAGDEDFEEALEYSREVEECEIYLVTFKESSSPKLHPHARRVLFLDPNDPRLRRQSNSTAFPRRELQPQLLPKPPRLSPEPSTGPSPPLRRRPFRPPNDQSRPLPPSTSQIESHARPVPGPEHEPTEQLSFFVDVSGNTAPARPRFQETPQSSGTSTERRGAPAMKTHNSEEPPAKKIKTEEPVSSPNPPSVLSGPVADDQTTKQTRHALKAQMAALIAKEDYEAAARVRDELKRLKDTVTSEEPTAPTTTSHPQGSPAKKRRIEDPVTSPKTSSASSGPVADDQTTKQTRHALKAQMAALIAKEDYEAAARVRDKLKKPTEAVASDVPKADSARAAAAAAGRAEAAKAAEAASEAEAARKAAAAEAERRARLTALKAEMAQLVAASDYEAAASIRDEIRRLEATGQGAGATGPPTAKEFVRTAEAAAAAAAAAEEERQARLSALKVEMIRMVAESNFEAAAGIRNEIRKLKAAGSAAGADANAQQGVASKAAEIARAAAAAREAAAAAEAEWQGRLNALKAEMRRLVEESSFEAAAGIRDEIRKLQAAGPVAGADAEKSEQPKGIRKRD